MGVADLERAIFDGATFTLLARSKSGEPCGIVQLIDVDAVDRLGDLAVLEFPALVGTGLIGEAATLFIDECFHRFSLRKIYASLSDVASAALGQIDTLFSLEGVLRGHVWLAGAFRDVHVYGASAQQFAQNVARSGFWSGMSLDGWRIFDQYPQQERVPDVREVVDSVSSILGVTLGKGNADVPLESLDLDSLDILELRSILEDHRGDEISDGAMESFRTVGDVLAMVEIQST